MNDLDWKGAVQDIQGAVDYLHSKGCTKVGVTGFCMGGALAIASSVLVNNVHAAAPFYGIPNKDLADPKLVKTVNYIFIIKFVIFLMFYCLSFHFLSSCRLS